MRRFVFALMWLFAAVLFSSASASAATYYVAPPPAGADTNAGTQAAPFATIQKAANVAIAGDTIIVTPGTYAGAKFTTSGTAGLPITLHGQDGAIVASPGALNGNLAGIWVTEAQHIVIENLEIKTVSGSGIVVAGPLPNSALALGITIRDNFIHDTSGGGIAVVSVFGCTISNNEIANCAGQAGVTAIAPSDNLLVSKNSIHGCSQGGVRLATSNTLLTTLQQAVIDSNVIFENGSGGGAGILLESVRNSLVVNNLIHDNAARGVEINDTANAAIDDANQIFNNTIVQSLGDGYPLAVLNGSSGNAILNNILLHTGALGSIEADSASLFRMQSDFNNLFGPISLDSVNITLASWQGLGFEANSISFPAGDIFVNLAGGNYDLKEGSEAIDEGRFVTGASLDIRGVSRPQGPSFDIGAYEFQKSEPPPPNQNPVAAAGPDQTVDAGDLVTLSGASSSDPDSDPLTFTWAQTAGPSVTLTGATTVSPTFTAPTLVDDVVLSFLLTVSDGRGGLSTDSVSVTVIAPPPAPTIIILKPTIGQVWKIGSKKAIKFVAPPSTVGDVRFELSRDGGVTFQTIIASVPVSKGKKKWVVIGPATNNAIVRVVLNQNPDVYGIMPAPFIIQP